MLSINFQIIKFSISCFIVVSSFSLYAMEMKHTDHKCLKKQSVSVMQKDIKSEQIEEIDTSKAGAFAQIPPELIAHILSFILIEDASDSSKLVKSLCRSQNFKSICKLFEKIITPQLLGRLIKDRKINVNMFYKVAGMFYEGTRDHMLPPLFLAVKKDLKEVTQLLLGRGADINLLVGMVIPTGGGFMYSFLLGARAVLVFAQSPEMIKLLLSKGLVVRKDDIITLALLDKHNSVHRDALFKAIENEDGAKEVVSLGLQEYKQNRCSEYSRFGVQFACVIVLVAFLVHQLIYDTTRFA